MPRQTRTLLTQERGVSSLQTYSFKKQDALLLTCAKCQRKLKGNGTALAKLRKPLKKLARAQGAKLLVLNTPCLKICPKGAVVVCTQRQLAAGTFSLLREESELPALVRAALLAPAQALAIAAAEDDPQPPVR